MKKILMLVAAAFLLQAHNVAQARSWWEEPWTASEKPYAQARKAVDRVRGNQNALSSLVSKWRPQMQAKPFDQVARYRWGYALYWLTRARVGEEDTKAYKEYGLIREGLQQSTFHDSEQARMLNHSYEFNRLRFWVEHKARVPLWQLGERVLQRNPDDIETQNILLRIWTSNCPPPKKAAAVALWRKVATRHRNDPITIYWSARIHDAVYNADERRYGKPNPADARTAVELYQRFLREAPDTQRYRRSRDLARVFARTVNPTAARKS